MTGEEYSLLCSRIINATMQHIDLLSLKAYKDLSRDEITSDRDIFYKDAATSACPASLVYTLPGTGKSQLICDRAKLLIKHGENPENILVLNANTAKAQQMAEMLPDVQSITFNDFADKFIDEIFDHPDKIDISSYINLVRLLPDSEFIQSINRAYKQPAQRDRLAMLTLSVNSHVKETASSINVLHKCTPHVNAMLLQNIIYTANCDPYHANAILVNGIQNMPVPTFCCVAQYANMHKSNLFMTGSPSNAIYDFVMAWQGLMDCVSNKNAGIFRLPYSGTMHPDIKSILDGTAKDIRNERVKFTSMSVTDESLTYNTFAESMKKDDGWVHSRIISASPFTIIAETRDDLDEIGRVLESMYPGIQICRLYDKPVPRLHYGTCATESIKDFLARYPDRITAGQFMYDLYNIMHNKMSITKSKTYKNTLETALTNMPKFMSGVFSNPNEILPVKNMMAKLILAEAKIMSNAFDNITYNDIKTLDSYNVTLMTVWMASDMRFDDTLVYIKSRKDSYDEALYRTALSRANQYTYIIFADYYGVKPPIEQYLTQHVK